MASDEKPNSDAQIMAARRRTLASLEKQAKMERDAKEEAAARFAEEAPRPIRQLKPGAPESEQAAMPGNVERKAWKSGPDDTDYVARGRTNTERQLTEDEYVPPATVSRASMTEEELPSRPRQQETTIIRRETGQGGFGKRAMVYIFTGFFEILDLVPILNIITTFAYWSIMAIVFLYAYLPLIKKPGAVLKIATLAMMAFILNSIPFVSWMPWNWIAIFFITRILDKALGGLPAGQTYE